jgi:hypothetical protein
MQVAQSKLRATILKPRIHYKCTLARMPLGAAVIASDQVAQIMFASPAHGSGLRRSSLTSCVPRRLAERYVGVSRGEGGVRQGHAGGGTK